MGRKKKLILSIIDGYDYPFVEPFIKSLNQTDYQDDLVIFTASNVGWATKKMLEKNGAILINYDQKFPFFNEKDEVFDDIHPNITINNYRFLFYLSFLKKNIENYENVMLTDIRDVIFQKNPFDYQFGNNICFFLEDSSNTFINSETNFKWSLEANGKEVTDAISQEIVSCAGITIGPINLIIDYLLNFKTAFSNKRESNWGLDQGLHNGYIYHLQPPNHSLITNEEPFVLTLGACNEFKLNQYQELVNHQDKVYAVVHQYDRINKLFMATKLKYNGNKLVQKLKRLIHKILP